MYATATLPTAALARLAAAAVRFLAGTPRPIPPPALAAAAREWPLPHRPEAAGTARRLARATLAEWGVDEDTTDQALLVVSELVTNAIEHALPPVVLHLDQPAPGHPLHIEVDDGGPAPDHGGWTSTCTPEEHGRGTDIIAALSTAHGHHPLPDGAAHWADLTTAG